MNARRLPLALTLPFALALKAAGALPVDDGTHLPPGFSIETVVGPLQQMTGLTFDPLGRLVYWQKQGLVWLHVEDGPDHLLLDLTEEVGNWGDHGLHGVALDPSYDINGRIYLYYVVDHHHLLHFGTPAYDPAVDETFVDTMARVTRYRMLDPLGAQPAVDPASRTVLVGERIGDGMAITSNTHGIGPLRFGTDGTLLFGLGDGWLSGTGSGTALAEGIIAPKEDIHAFRSQLVDSHNGKILRIDPETGAGVPSNPFYDPLDPHAAASQVWVLGLRNPYSFSLVPGTGTSDPAAGDPGVLVIGDVGSSRWEEIDVAASGGLNFGWPLYEGYQDGLWESTFGDLNLDAPNPLAGGSCPAYFHFRDLLAEDSLHPPAWPNPCNPAVQVPPEIPTFVHERPILVWGHLEMFPVPTTLVKDYDAGGAAIAVPIDDPSSAVDGEPFGGNCAISGAWYGGGAFPPEFTNAFFIGDFGVQVMKALELDPAYRLVAVREFGEETGAITRMEAGADPDELYQVRYYGPGGSRIERIVHGSLLPSVKAAVTPAFGPAPHRAQLSAEALDPAGKGLAYAWDFGDGSPPSPIQARPEPVHVYPSEDVTASGTIVSKLDELVPPTPMGLGNPNPEVIREGSYPPPSAGAFVQFDTAHVDAALQPDKGGEDYVGYVFPAERTFVGVIFQEGWNLPPYGGWFETLTVQVRSAATGAWGDVVDLASLPASPGDPATSFETFQLLFEPVRGDGVRIHGVPGGAYDFVSVGELRALATPEPATGAPQAFTPSVEVTDGLGQTAADAVLVAVNDTPPAVTITSPPNGLAYAPGPATVVALTSVASDLEHGPGQLTCEWSVKQVHDNHVHAEPLDPSCASTATLVPHGELQGDVVYYEIELTVSDPLGLATGVKHFAYQENDCNLNGFDDVEDILLGRSDDVDLDGVPDECQTDCDANGLHDVFELVTGSGADDNESGVLDACEPVLLDLVPGIPGLPSDLELVGAEPQSLVAFAAGFQKGSTPLPLCDDLAMGIASPLLLGVVAVDPTGGAVATLGLPEALPPGTTLQLQAIDFLACEASNLVSFAY
jgi:glucose/arabinose dehydrogenase